jgi:hypothetical protein
MIDRRNFLVGSAAVAVLAAAPPLAIVPTPSLPAWAVGTEGDWNWKVIRAPTIERAKAIWCGEEYGDCRAIAGLMAQRKEEWDAIPVRVGDETWFKSGLGVNCDRCGCETWESDDAEQRGSEFICRDCVMSDCDIEDVEDGDA